jgi:hypothetical protein
LSNQEKKCRSLQKRAWQVDSTYNGSWFFGRPTLEDLRQDLRAVKREAFSDVKRLFVFASVEKEITTTLEAETLISASLQDLVREMLIRLGEDPECDGLRDTPGRVERSMQYLTAAPSCDRVSFRRALVP